MCIFQAVNNAIFHLYILPAAVGLPISDSVLQQGMERIRRNGTWPVEQRVSNPGNRRCSHEKRGPQY